MKYNRIFIFGCSWSKYHWPTWADIVRYSTDIPVYNHAMSGIGNVGIHHNIVLADLHYKFTDDDLIIVQWTSWTREDYYVHGNWQCGGNIFNNPHYNSEYLKKHWNWENDVVKNTSAILSASKAFNIKYQFNMMPFFEKEIDRDDLRGLFPVTPMTKFLTDHLPTLDTFPNGINTRFRGATQDPHPDIAAHLYFFNNYIKPKFNFLSFDKESEILELYETISTTINPNMEYSKVATLIKPLVQQFDKDFRRD